MADSEAQFIDVARLRPGIFVFIDLGWMTHPFPFNSFRISSQEQIDTIAALGLQRVRFDPARSELPAAANDALAPVEETAAEAGQRQLHALVAAQRARLKLCERQFADASRGFRQVAENARKQPQMARDQAETLVHGVVDKLVAQEESCIRLLSEQVGERAALHAVNVTVISLLLGKACGFDEAALRELGLGALLHDIGKADLPDRLRWRDHDLSAVEARIYQDHVRFSLEVARKMGLSVEAQRVVAQHHEHADGSGYPSAVRADRMTSGGKIVALVNHYDNLCNPSNPAFALTPHEALSQMFAQAKAKFDATVLGGFIRMMGIYPPGSVVQLTDERYAIVVSVNSSRPLKPSVIIHDPAVAREEALIVALDEHPELGIRRSLKPIQLPKSTIDYLSPQQRICYFFERARLLGDDGGAA